MSVDGPGTQAGDAPAPAGTEAAGVGKRGGGWGIALLLAVFTANLTVVEARLLIFVPMGLLLLALPPRRPWLVVVAAALLTLTLVGPAGDAFWYAQRGWAVVLAGWFVVAVILLPRARFIGRALAAVGATVATAALLLAVTRNGWSRVDWQMGYRLRGEMSTVLSVWGPAAASKPWGRQFADLMYRAADVQALLHPALLALGSLSALAVAWWGYRRLAFRERRPLAALREFRFKDELVWLLIAGILLLVLPLGDVSRRAGSNVVAFMGALYAVRGAGVMVALGSGQGVAGVLLAALGILFLYPLVMAATVVVGLADTWFDIRARRAAAGPST